MGDRIFCLAEDGQTSVLRAGGTFRLLHTNTFGGEMCMSTTALVGDRLLICADRHVYSIRNPSRQP